MERSATLGITIFHNSQINVWFEAEDSVIMECGTYNEWPMNIIFLSPDRRYICGFNGPKLSFNSPSSFCSFFFFSFFLFKISLICLSISLNSIWYIHQMISFFYFHSPQLCDVKIPFPIGNRSYLATFHY